MVWAGLCWWHVGNSAGAPRSANHAALDKRAREVERRRKSAFAGAAKVSVEGRGLGQYI